jgi:periplasmic protein TonB
MQGWSFLLAIMLAVVAVGAYGALYHRLSLPVIRELATEEVTALPLGELVEIPTHEVSAEVTEPIELEPAAFDAVQPVEVAQIIEMPEAIEALTTEDIFAVPLAVKLVDPQSLAQAKPKTLAPKPAVLRTTSTATISAPRSTGGSTMATSGSPTARGGRMPSPAYPSFARSARMEGSVGLRISVSPSGSVDGVSVTVTSGYSALDDFVASYVRRSWKLKPGPAGSYTKTFTFRMR